MALTLQQRLDVMKANTEDVKQRNQISLDNKQFSLKAFGETQKIKMDWVRVRMEWNKHIQEVRKMLIANLKEEEVLGWMRGASRTYEANRVKMLRAVKNVEKNIKKKERDIQNASRILLGSNIPKNHITRAWRSFGRVVLWSRTKFPTISRDNTCFYSVRTNKTFITGTTEMTLNELSFFCREHGIVVETSSPEFDVIYNEFVKIMEEENNALSLIQTKLASLEEKALALNQQQWKKAGLF